MIALVACLICAPSPSVSLSMPGEVVILRPAFDAARVEIWRTAPEERPGLRGFRAPIFDRAGDPLVLQAEPGVDAGVARIIAERLAREGLRATLVAALVRLRADSNGGLQAAEVAPRLEGAGFPVDCLRFWSPAGAETLVESVWKEVDADRPATEITADLARLNFAFEPTVPGFRIVTECGEEAVGAVRLQVSSATDYAEPGAGGAMDVFRSLARRMPDAEILVGVETKHLAGVEAEARSLAAARSAPITIIESPLPLAQWAQDNAKAGIVEASEARSVVWLAPRYASRGEDGTTFIPAENLALEGLASAGRSVRVSPLLFQGGDLMALRDPTNGKRYLLVGEAEIARNRALGLTRDEVLDAFRGEFGVDSCVVLPAVSFHVDLEVCVRTNSEGVVACVLDTSAGARVVLHCGVAALERAHLVDADAARLSDADIDADRHAEFFARIGPVLETGQHAAGRFTLEFARHFQLGDADSGVGNLERFLLAIDLWTAARIGESSAEELGLDPDSFAYLTSMRRREADRIRVANAFAGLGWKLAAVPGLSDETRSIDPLNGLHLRGAYLMPTYGGLFAPLDDAAETAFRAAFGTDVSVERVPTGETQRRAGGLHCAAALEPVLKLR